MGTSRFLKEKRRDIRAIAVEPDGPFHGLEGLKHMETAMVPPIYDQSAVDETFRVSTEDAEAEVRTLAREEGLFVGWSTGAAVLAARRVLKRDGGVVVAIAPDGGQRYLSEIGRLLRETQD